MKSDLPLKLFRRNLLRWLLPLALLGLPLMAQEAKTAASAEAASDTPVASEAPPTAALEEEEVYFGQSLVEKLQKGGITVVFLLLLSVAGLSFTLERFSSLKRKHIIPDGLVSAVETAWKSGDFTAAESACARQPSTAARMLETYLQYRDVPASELSPIVGDIASRELKRHLQRAYPLAVIGAVAPLLGLMGTVFGMIESFDTVAAAGSLGDASILADGISKALVTTAVGLVVAVPFLLLYHMFKTQTTLFAIDLEEEITEFSKRVLLRKTGTEAAHGN